MDTDELPQQLKALRERIQPYSDDNPWSQGAGAARAQVTEFLRRFAGPKSAFTQEAEALDGSDEAVVTALTAILDSFAEFLHAGFASDLSPERRAQIDVVSDYLGQAQQMLEAKGHHPAAPAVLIGASLEEFLRNWIEAAGLSLGNAKPGLDAYCKTLRTAELISKQDVKDITSWAGIRNHAAHGEWDQVSDRDRVRLMLEGVNLFMRQKAGQ